MCCVCCWVGGGQHVPQTERKSVDCEMSSLHGCDVVWPAGALGGCCGPDLRATDPWARDPRERWEGSSGIESIGLESLPHHLLPIQPFCRLTNFPVPQFPHQQCGDWNGPGVTSLS